MKNKKAVGVSSLLLFSMLVILYLYRINSVQRSNLTNLRVHFGEYKQTMQNLILSENGKIENNYLIDYLGQRITIEELSRRNAEGLLVIYFPKCICSIEKDKYLNKLEQLKVKKKIIIFDEMDFHKVATLKRLGQFDCDLYCDQFSSLNLPDNKDRDIFTFVLDSDLKYKNVVFPRTIDSINYLNVYDKILTNIR